MNHIQSRVFLRLSILSISLSLNSCVVESKNPLSNPDDSVPDHRLYGQWKRTEKDGSGAHVFFGRPWGNPVDNLPSGIMVSNAISCGPNHAISGYPQITWLFTTNINEENYANVIAPELLDREKHPQWERANIKSVHIAKYAISGDQLTIWIMDVKSAASVVQRGQLKGQVKRSSDGSVDEVMLTESAEVLSGFLRNGGSKTLFPEKNRQVYYRVKW